MSSGPAVRRVSLYSAACSFGDRRPLPRANPAWAAPPERIKPRRRIGCLGTAPQPAIWLLPISTSGPRRTGSHSHRAVVLWFQGVFSWPDETSRLRHGGKAPICRALAQSNLPVPTGNNSRCRAGRKTTLYRVVDLRFLPRRTPGRADAPENRRTRTRRKLRRRQTGDCVREQPGPPSWSSAAPLKAADGREATSYSCSARPTGGSDRRNTVEVFQRTRARAR